jgi:hypothetical protein
VPAGRSQAIDLDPVEARIAHDDGGKPVGALRHQHRSCDHRWRVERLPCLAEHPAFNRSRRRDRRDCRPRHELRSRSAVDPVPWR